MKRSLRNYFSGIVVGATLCLLVGCGTKVTLMPTPVIYHGGRINVFESVPPDLRTNTLDVFYATNRSASGKMDDRDYGNGMEKDLRLGRATVKFGDKSWDELVAASTTGDRKDSITLTRERAVEMGTLPANRQPSDAGNISQGEKAWADEINNALDRVATKQILIYVQGFRDDFDGSCDVAAELRHFLGRRQVVVAYAWPCRQRMINYGGDGARASDSGPGLARLVEFLATNTKAQNINILGYSAGAKLVVNGAVTLRQRHKELAGAELGKKFRVGNVILVGADVDFEKFVKEQLVDVAAVPEYIEVTVSQSDEALGMSAKLRTASRLGRPDIKALNQKEIEAVAKETKLYAVNVAGVKGPQNEGQGIAGHGYWYANPWISSDILITFIWQITPDQRGLVQEPGRRTWIFPPDYPDRVHEVVSKQLELLRTKNPTATTMPSLSRGTP